MRNRKNNRRSLVCSIISLLLCISMLLGTTLAWFTDSVSSTGNIIKTGRLDVTMEYTGDLASEWKDASNATIFEGNLWEPGYSDVKYIKVSNTGNLAFQYQMHVLPAIAPVQGEVNLSDVIDVYVEKVTDPENFVPTMDESNKKTLTQYMTEAPATCALLPAGATATAAAEDVGSVTYCVILHMQEDAGNEYQNLTVGNNFNIQLIAAQYGYESDAFGNTYDANAEYADLVFPEMIDMDMGSADVTVDSNNQLTEDVVLKGKAISATVKAGTLLKEGTNKLTLTVEELEDTSSNITLGEGEEMRSLDVHVSGIAEGNTVPVIISLGKVAPEYLNVGNLKLAHVENGVTVPMTRVDALTDLDAHNEFYYDLLEGELTVAMASFSELAVVADTDNAWNGVLDYSWYDAAAASYQIANADQLAGLGAIVGGMDGKTADSFKGKTVKLIADISIGDLTDEDGRNVVFYPIGYYNSEGTYEKSNKAITSGFKPFEGTFDGNGHTISDFYQNTWEMKGDDNYYPAEEQRYRDGMGLFGKVYGGTVKNLTVSNFKSDGEYTTTGVIAAYADGATFENIAIFDCNPRVYNIGNGGIVGCVGWYAEDAGMKTTLKNITVDNTNKISSLWGSWDTACGGLVGQYYPTSGQGDGVSNAGISMENCHVAAQIDVYNDVCANYQYYAYRYSGMLIGSVRENVEVEGHLYPKMDGIEAKDCTVHFGDWNDYYYCELVANSLASYTHDHQMSRLEQVASVDVANKKVTSLKGVTTDIPNSGRVNYVVVKDKDGDGKWIHGDGHGYADCYHFVNGVQHFHDVADSDNPNPTETVDGVEGVLKEDKQLVYREFNNLVTGYGWGVTSKGIGEMPGVDILDREEAVSVAKFATVDGARTRYMTGATVKVGDLFKDAGSDVVIDADNVRVFVSPANKESTASGIYTANSTDWTQGTLTLAGKGEAIISITDYNYCRPTILRVAVNPYIYTITYREGDTVHHVEEITDNSTEILAEDFYKMPGLEDEDYQWVNAGSTFVTSIPKGNENDVVLYLDRANTYVARFLYQDGTLYRAIEFNNQNGKLNEEVPAVPSVDGLDVVGWESYTLKGAKGDISVKPIYKCNEYVRLEPVDTDNDGITNYYRVVGSTISKDRPNVTIPESVNGIKIQEIAQGAFENGDLQDVFVPNFVDTIGKNAFAKDDDAFMGIFGGEYPMIQIIFDGTKDQWEGINKTKGEWDDNIGTGSTIVFLREKTKGYSEKTSRDNSTWVWRDGDYPEWLYTRHPELAGTN